MKMSFYASKHTKYNQQIKKIPAKNLWIVNGTVYKFTSEIAVNWICPFGHSRDTALINPVNGHLVVG